MHLPGCPTNGHLCDDYASADQPSPAAAAGTHLSPVCVLVREGERERERERYIQKHTPTYMLA